MRRILGVVLAAAALLAAGSADARPGRNGPLVWATAKVPQVATIRVAAPGGKARKLAIGGDVDASTDGKRIAFDADVGGSTHVFVETSAGTGLRDLGPGLGPEWSPDGERLLVYVYGSGTSQRFSVISADGKNRRSLGVGTDASWSPDGKQIALSAKQLTVVDADSGAVVRRLGEGRDATWSPDGTRIAFSRFADPDGEAVFVVALDGAAPAMVGQPGMVDSVYLTWSPDGRRLVFNTDFDAQPGESLGRSLMVVDVATGKKKEIRTDFKVLEPTWSPDGKRIAYELDHGEQHTDVIEPSGVAVVNADGTGRHEISEGESPVWSHDGSLLAFAESYGLAHGVVTVRPDGSGRRLIPLPGSRGVGPPHWLARSLVWYDFAAGSDSQIFTSEASGSSVNAVAPDYTDFDPAWSPNGRMLAVVEEVTPNPDAEEHDDVIDVMRADGSGRRQLSAGLAPAWSPNGRSIVFVHGRALYVMPVTGGRPRKIAGTRGASSPAWSPDGRWIAYARGGSLLEVTPDGKSRRKLTAGRAPAFSPSGKRIAFNRGSALFVVPTGGGTPRRLSRAPVTHPAWSPDGRLIAGDGGVIVSVATGAVRTVAALAKARAVNLDWQPRR